MILKVKLNLWLIVFALLAMLQAGAQSPQFINYQAVARNLQTGVELSNQSVFLSVKILKDSPNGMIVYQENHDNIETNAYGIINLRIGNGDAISGSFAGIDWATASHWLALDIDAGNGMESLGTMQFLSVPYALHAGSVTNSDDADANPENELVTNFTFDPDNTTLTLSQPGGGFTADLSSLLPDVDGDSDATNELVEDFIFDEDLAELSIIQQGGSVLSQNLGSLINDADADPNNEAITSFTFVDNGLQLNEVQNWFVNLSSLINDADADPENEKITALELSNDSTLSITEGASNFQVDLSSIRRDADWSIAPDTSVMRNIPEKVVIGAGAFNSSLQINTSLGFGYQIIESTSSPITYIVTETDHIIVCKVAPPASAQITIDLPAAVDCQGRVLIVRKTGTGPFVTNVRIFFGGDNLDFNSISNLNLNEFQPQTVTLLSLGSDGWTRIYRE